VDTKGEKRKKTRKEEERIEGEKQLPLNARELTSLRRKLEISHSSDVPSVESEEKKKGQSRETERERERRLTHPSIRPRLDLPSLSEPHSTQPGWNPGST